MKRVFLLEDHASFRDTLAVILRWEPDLEVVGQAGSLAEARVVGPGRWDEVDLAIVDLLLPDGDGAEAIGELRDAAPGLPVLALTIIQDAETLRRAREMGADEVMLKDAPIEDILGAIRRLAK